METTLNELLKTPGTDEKIEKISQEILKKNQTVKDKLLTLRIKRTQLVKQETEFIKLASATTRQIAADCGKNMVYAPTCGKIQKNKIALANMFAKDFETGNANADIAHINGDDNSVLDWEGKEDAEKNSPPRNGMELG